MSVDIETAEALVRANGCARCQRRRRSAHAWVLQWCAACARTPLAWRPFGWCEIRVWDARYLLDTEAPWAVFTSTGADSESYWAPSWVVTMLGMGTEVRHALGSRAPPRAAWTFVISEAARNHAFRAPLLTVCELGDVGALVAWLRANVEVYAQINLEEKPCSPTTRVRRSRGRSV